MGIAVVIWKETCSRFQQNLAVWAYSNIKKDARLSMPQFIQDNNVLGHLIPEIQHTTTKSSIPSHCVCGKTFTLEHVLTCPKGGFINLRHNELQDFTAKLLNECHTNVKIKPVLIPLSGETFTHATAVTTNKARVDIAATGIWVKGKMALFDVFWFLTKLPKST